MAKIKVELSPAKRMFDGDEYILTKINYTEEAAKEDQVYYNERGKKANILEEGGYWLLYTKVGS